LHSLNPKSDHGIIREPVSVYDDTRQPDLDEVYEAIHPIESDHKPITIDGHQPNQSTVLANKANVIQKADEYEITSFQLNDVENPTSAETYCI